MDDNQNNSDGEIGESPKRVFRLLPRPVIRPVLNGEDPKEFLRRMAQRAQPQDPNPGNIGRE